MKKTASFLIAVILLFFCVNGILPVAAGATEATEPAPEGTIGEASVRGTMNAASAGELKLGKSKSLELSQDEEVTYTFTTEEAGYYVITVPYWVTWVDDQGREYHGLVSYRVCQVDGMHKFDKQSQFVDGSNLKLFLLEENTQYSITLINDTDKELLSTKVKVARAAEPEGILLDSSELTSIGMGMNGGADQTIQVKGFVPSTAFCDLTWTSSDESVVRIDNVELMSCEYTTVGYGTAVLTATAPNGVSTTYTVTVNEPGKLSDQPTRLTLTQERGAQFTFTPEESGRYTFITTPLSSISKFANTIYDEEGNWATTYNISGYLTGYEVAELTAGKTYSVWYSYLNPGGNPENTCEVSVIKTPKVEKLIMPDKIVEYISAYSVNREVTIPIEFEPHNSYGKITYESDNWEVISVRRYNGRENLVKGDAGTAKITVYLDGVKYKTVKVTLKEPGKIDKMTIPDYSGYVGDLIHVHPVCQPEGAPWSIRMQASNTWVAAPYGNDTTYGGFGPVTFQLKNPGTTKVTATEDNGAKTTFTITVRKKETIKPGWEKKLTIKNTKDEYRYTLIPEKSGEYVIVCPLGIESLVRFAGSEAKVEYKGQRAEIVKLNAGEEYEVVFRNPVDTPVTGTVTLKKLKKPTSVALNKSKITFYYNPLATDMLTLTAHFDDIAKWSKLTWTTSDPDILSVKTNSFTVDESANSHSFGVKGTGTVTVTVTTENGLSDSCMVTIKEAAKTKTLDLVVPAYAPAGKEFAVEMELSSGKAVVAPHVTYSGTAKVEKWSVDGNFLKFTCSAEGTLRVKVLDELTGLTDTVTLKVSDKVNAPVIELEGVASSGKNKVTWNKLGGIGKYQVYRATSEDGDYTKLTTTSKTYYTDKSAVAGKKYYYKVRAVTEDGVKSSYSNIESRYCDLPCPVVDESNVSSSGKIKLKWAKIEGAKEYAIYRATSKTGTYKKLATTDDTDYTDKTAKAGKVYYYKVKAIHKKSNANSAYSSVVGQTCKLTRPVVDESNVADTGKIKLKWDKIEGAEKYKIYRRVGKSGDYEYYAGTETNSYTDNGAQAGSVYYYKVEAIHAKSAGNSAKSSGVGQTCKLARPVVDESNVADTGKIKLKWDKIEGAESYKIYRRVGKSGDYEYHDSSETNVYIDNGAQAGTVYYYKVEAIHAKSAANSAQSSGVGQTCKLPAPKVELANVPATGNIQLKWEKIEGAIAYKIYRLAGRNGEYEELACVADSEYIDTDAIAGASYRYQVIAIHGNSSANSAKSAEVEGVCKLAQPNVTIQLFVTGDPELIWEGPQFTVEYEIYRATSEDGEYQHIESMVSPYFMDSSTEPGITYYYKVKATKANSNSSDADSEFSAVVSITAE